jgi:hypothetical protein
MKRTPSQAARARGPSTFVAVRLTGKSTDLVARDGPALELVMDDLQDSFVRKLSDADLANLITELEGIAFGSVVEGSRG